MRVASCLLMCVVFASYVHGEYKSECRQCRQCGRYEFRDAENAGSSVRVSEMGTGISKRGQQGRSCIARRCVDPYYRIINTHWTRARVSRAWIKSPRLINVSFNPPIITVERARVPQYSFCVRDVNHAEAESCVAGNN